MPAGFTSYLHCYLHLFGLDPVTTAVWFLSVDLTASIVVRQTMAFASSIHNNLSLPEIFISSLIVSQPVLVDTHIIA
jgi:hypothetical protein